MAAAEAEVAVAAVAESAVDFVVLAKASTQAADTPVERIATEMGFVQGRSSHEHYSASLVLAE